jgi:hypothetical protein
MGEEKTTSNFIAVSLLMLLLLLLYPLLALGIEKTAEPPSQFAVGAVMDVVRLEKEVTKLMSFMVRPFLCRTRISFSRPILCRGRLTQ